MNQPLNLFKGVDILLSIKDGNNLFVCTNEQIASAENNTTRNADTAHLMTTVLKCKK